MENNRDYERSGYYGNYDESEQRAPVKKPHKKKRSKISRFFRALGKYIAHLPTQTLAVAGVSIAVVLVAVILLIVLLPRSGAGSSTDNLLDGQLSISDPTPTPSLAPTDVPEPTEEPTPTPDPDPLAGTVIATVGETNDAIPDIQKRLVELGYMDMPSGGYTTTYGPATKNGIRRFQLRNFDNYKKVDGQIGSETYNLLMSDDAKGFWYKKGDTDEELYIDRVDGVLQTGWVTRLQERLIALGYMSGKATGTYGDSTATAVKLFQQYHGLTPIDGLAGQSTLTILYGADAMDAVTGALNDKSKLAPTPGTDAATPDPASITPGA